MNKEIVFDISMINGEYNFDASLCNEINKARKEIEKVEENLESINKLNVECDKIDYILATSSGVISGVFDIFLVGKPYESYVGKNVDKWYDEKVKMFAKLSMKCDKNKKEIKKILNSNINYREKLKLMSEIDFSQGKCKNVSVKEAIRYFEKKSKIPYDQTHLSDVTNEMLGRKLSTTNHHFLSLGHNKTLLGLFYSILDQFNNESHFVGVGNQGSGNKKFILKGKNTPGKIFYGFINWYVHILSDVSGSSSKKIRGSGIPSTLESWTNDLVVLSQLLKIKNDTLVKNLNVLAEDVFKAGFDKRFEKTQVIPVILNECVVRMLYATRRMFKYFSITLEENRNLKEMVEYCKSKDFSLKRMLTVAHGTFCVVDCSDAIICGFKKGKGKFSVKEFFLRLNIQGTTRFVICIRQEVSRQYMLYDFNKNAYYIKSERRILNNYIKGLKELSILYNDDELLNFTKDFEKSNMYKMAFCKTIKLARKRSVPEKKILKNKKEIDRYFMGEA